MSCEDLSSSEMEESVHLVRALVGDLEGSIFYPVLSDAEIEAILRIEKCNVMRASRRVATSIAFYLTTTNYRERAGDIDVINNASIQYGRVLRDFLTNYGDSNIPDDIVPYAGGASIREMCRHINDPDVNRNPLLHISPCIAWWTQGKQKYECSKGSC